MKKPVLTVVIAILAAAGILFGLTAALNGTAAKNEKAVLLKTMQNMLPGSSSFEIQENSADKEGVLSAYKGETGFVVETQTDGYAGKITMLVAVSNDGKVMGLLVKDMNETYGLGAKALSDWKFLAGFLGTGGNAAIGTEGADAFSGAIAADDSDAEEYVDGMSGATVTSKAVARCVNAAVAYVTGADVESGATSWGG